MYMIIQVIHVSTCLLIKKEGSLKMESSANNEDEWLMLKNRIFELIEQTPTAKLRAYLPVLERNALPDLQLQTTEKQPWPLGESCLQ